jgi:hypothetical protein
VCVPSKKFQQHVEFLFKRHDWIRLTLDVFEKRLTISADDMLPNPITFEFPIRFIKPPLPLITSLTEKNQLDVSTAIEIQSFLTPQLPTRISIVCSAEKLYLFAFAHEVNSFVRLWMAPNTELLMEYVIRESPSSMSLSSRLECWVGYQEMKQNDALLQSTPHTVAFKESRPESIVDAKPRLRLKKRQLTAPIKKEGSKKGKAKKVQQ